VGDQIVYKFNGFHTVTFEPSRSALPSVFIQGTTPYPPQNDAAGNPWWWGGVVNQYMFNPEAVAPSGGNVVDSSHLPNSGLPQGRQFVVTFAEAGTFDYFCEIHPYMHGQVKVFPKGHPAANQDVQRGQKQQAEDAAQAQSIFDKLNAKPATNRTVTVGGGNRDISILHFFPENPVVHAGDVLSFRWDSQEPHTVTFGPDELLDQLLQSFISPDGIFDPVAALPSEPPGTAKPIELTPNLHGNGFLNSGVFDQAPNVISPTVPGTGPLFKVRFNTPGTYHFECLVHGPIMEGDVTVLPA